MKFPLELSFKIIAVAPQIRVKDADSESVLYVRQKILKLREHVEVFTDDSKAEKLCDIRANKMIDWSATYAFTDPSGNALGGIRRHGARSLWRAHYEVVAAGGGDVGEFTVREEKVMAKVMDGIFGSIPVIGALAGYVFNPSYIVTRPDGTPVIRVTKQPAMWEGKFTIEQLAELENTEQVRTLLGLLMMLLLERNRG